LIFVFVQNIFLEQYWTSSQTFFHFFYDNSPRELQIEAFKAHVQAAKITKLPLIIHTRAANEETIEVLQEERGILPA
tara:strand:- start:256 stop:486 length:231 start_codon:yes stop_codon:yes gene_type:complete